MEIRLALVAGRTARADLKGGILHVRMPRHWPRSEKEAAIARFEKWAARRASQLAELPPPVSRMPLTEGQLWDLVRLINADTLRVDVAGVRIGRARFSRLAQANWQTRILTFSRLAVNSLPDRALRYLIIHELAHLRVPNHSPAFWQLVERFEPVWKYWRKVAQVHFVRAAEFGNGHMTHLPTVHGPAAAQRPDSRPGAGPQPFYDSDDDDDPGRPAYDDGDCASQIAGETSGNHAGHCNGQSAGDLAAKALFDDLTGPHGIQMALFADLAPEYTL